MKPLKCLAISNSFPPDHAGGYELGARNLLNALRDHAGWQNTVVSSMRKIPPAGVAPPELTGFFPGSLGPDVERWKTRRSLLARHSTILEDLAKQAERADLILVFNPRRLIYPQWTSVLASGKPAFVFVSDYWPLDPLASDVFYTKSPKLQSTGQLKDFQLHKLYAPEFHKGALFENFRGAIFASRFLQNETQSAFSKVQNQSVAHWGIDTKQFPKIPFSEQRLKTFGFCGRPQKEKGLELALRAFRELATSTPEVELLIASDLAANTFGKSIRKQIQGDPLLKDRVSLLGHIPHEELHARFYSKIGVLLFTSVWQEPFALTVLEAMASGVLVIGSSTGGTPEVVDASAGYLFDPQSPGELCEMCRKMIYTADGNLERVDAGAARIRNNHSLSYMARSVDTFVRGLL